MSDRQGNHRELFEQIHQLVTARINDEMTPEQFTRLDALLSDSVAARRLYVRYIYETLALPSLLGTADSLDALPLPLEEGVSEGHGLQGAGRGAKDEDFADSEPFAPPIILDPPPSSRYPLATNYSFVDGPVFPYMVATMILGVMLLGFWAYKITHHQHIAEAPSQSAPSRDRPEMVFVGRITGMVDVKWSDDPRFLPPLGFAHVPLGRKYILSSGLMEITYDSGAKVILEGPCTYEVESSAGGYLSLGKLTARVGAGGGGRGTREEKGSRFKVQGSRSKPEPSSFILHPSSLFSVRTPTAIVTDLGTEFGVEVSEEGATESRVFRGSVKVQVVGDSPPSPSGRGVILRENESARVEGRGKPRITMLGVSAKTADFTRGMPKVTYKTLDLVDVVAGGDGFSGRRNRGIDPTNGQAGAITPKDASSEASWFAGDGKYHRVEALPLVDGVFIPDGGKGAVRVDSAGNTFAGFPDTRGAAWKPIWAGGKIPTDPPSTAFLRGIDYASPPHCLLFLHANNGITFDLEAIRRANPGSRLLRFLAVAGNSSEAMSSPDGARVAAGLWVLVDGQVCFERREVNGYSGAFPVLISIGGDDRFLTLATTDGGNNAMHGDWTMFGDPRLDLMQVEANEPE